MGPCTLAVLTFDGMDGYVERKARREAEGKKPLGQARMSSALMDM